MRLKMRGLHSIEVRGRARAVAALSVTLLVAALLVTPACSAGRTPRPANWATPIHSVALTNWYKLDAEVYRSEQPTRLGFEEIRDAGIRTVINLRDRHTDATALEGLGLDLVEVPMNAGSFGEAEIVKALKAIRDARKPVLIHCQRGADRTGVVAAMYRVVFEGWAKEDAIDELLHGGYGFNRIWYHNIPKYIRNSDPAKLRALIGLPR
jgi:tyrosine-protein phosphatase SIW14